MRAASTPTALPLLFAGPRTGAVPTQRSANPKDRAPKKLPTAERNRRIQAQVPIRAKGAAEYRPMFVDTVLNENANKSLPFFWTINPYRGCEFGCGYCYARYTHEFLDHRRSDEFERRIYVKLRAGQILAETMK